MCFTCTVRQCVYLRWCREEPIHSLVIDNAHTCCLGESSRLFTLYLWQVIVSDFAISATEVLWPDSESSGDSSKKESSDTCSSIETVSKEESADTYPSIGTVGCGNVNSSWEFSAQADPIPRESTEKLQPATGSMLFSVLRPIGATDLAFRNTL